MPFEKGNRAAAGGKQKLFLSSLKRAIAQDDGARIRRAAEKLLDLAAEGEAWALRELADRLDGKATEHVQISDNRETREMTDAELLHIASSGSERAAETPVRTH